MCRRKAPELLGLMCRLESPTSELEKLLGTNDDSSNESRELSISSQGYPMSLYAVMISSSKEAIAGVRADEVAGVDAKLNGSGMPVMPVVRLGSDEGAETLCLSDSVSVGGSIGISGGLFPFPTYLTCFNLLCKSTI